MLDDATPFGTTLHLPRTAAEDLPYPHPERHAEVAAFFEREGYVVLRGLLPAAVCDAVRDAFNAEVRPSRVPILRQKNMRYERNAFDAEGLLKNPIFNFQDLETQRFRRFKRAALDALTHPRLAATIAALLGKDGPAKLVQTMFFEAPAGTWAHQDSYYQDSAESLGRCVAAWVALEDIEPGAGRFYVVPRSHRLMPVLRNAGDLAVAPHHERYKQAMVEAVREAGLECHAPALKKGDVLLWGSLTVHGSLPAGRRGASRTSLTAHYLREADEMLQFHARIRRQAQTRHNGMAVCLLHDQDRLCNRMVRALAWHLPGVHSAARRAAIRTMLTLRGGKRDAAAA
jgi:phytanoyl-CoA hydroxylase